jgi:ABC-2 type transport system ATP-binding protein
MNKAIDIINLAHSYNDVQALKPMNLSVYEGEIFGFIGPDGSGKTTLFRILTSLMVPKEGQARVLNLDVVKDYKKLRTLLGYMPGRFSLYQDLTVEENLRFFAGLFRTSIKKNYHLIADIYDQLMPFKNRPAGKLSGGMKQKLALSCALIHKPRLLFLDEPTTGVDVVSRAEFWEMLQRLKIEGITVVVSTPYMDEASQCDRMALMQSGHVLRISSPQDLISSFDKDIIAIHAKNRQQLSKDLQAFDYTYSSYWFGDSLHWIGQDGCGVEDLEAYLNSKNHQGLSLEKIVPETEDCFMDLMSKKAWNKQ